MEYDAAKLFSLLNELDECPTIEAKLGSEASKSMLESICAFANEPNLGGGYLLLGVKRIEESLFPGYKIHGLENPDNVQQEIANQCNIMFNVPVRPEMKVENLQGKTVLVIFVNEVPESQKPIYFNKIGLPKGAMRRIGSVDLHCTEDDMRVFYQSNINSYDSTPVPDTNIELDVDAVAIRRYRDLRANVNPLADELNYNDSDLLKSLGCVNRKKPTEFNLAGLLLFGSSVAQRSTYPMLRIDYIRVPGNEWVKNPDNRFTTIDMRGPLFLNVFRIIDAINADLPKGFLLKEGNLQAQSSGLPIQALREAIVNAIMHRSYRENKPTQIIRYDNRIEIINPGFSLKNDEALGEPGSETRNQFIAAAFHETNLAETKGSGIKAMRRLMREANLALPTFESNRQDNVFTARLLLHHFLDKKDLEWLKNFDRFNLNDNQKQALVFVREVNAIDNQTYRQMSDCDTLKASQDLRTLKKYNLLEVYGKGRETYYTAGPVLIKEIIALSTGVNGISTGVNGISAGVNGISTVVNSTSDEAKNIEVVDDQIYSNADFTLSTEALKLNRKKLIEELPAIIQDKINNLKERERDINVMSELILEICKIRPFRLSELAALLAKGDNYIRRRYIKPLIESDKMEYVHSEINHPLQSYKTKI
jgi:ATP-dependent DNA helicase RecG